MVLQTAVFKLAHVISHMLHIFILAASIEHNVEVIVIDFCDDAVISDPSFFIHQQRKTCLAMMKGLGIHYCHVFEKCRCVFPSEVELAHVRHIKNSAGLPSLSMLFDNTAFISGV